MSSCSWAFAAREIAKSRRAAIVDIEFFKDWARI
jgi:hypothetical protein